MLYNIFIPIQLYNKMCPYLTGHAPLPEAVGTKKFALNTFPEDLKLLAKHVAVDKKISLKQLICYSVADSLTIQNHFGQQVGYQIAAPTSPNNYIVWSLRAYLKMLKTAD